MRWKMFGERLNERFSHKNIFSETRRIPESPSVITAKRASEDKEFALEFNIVLGNKNDRATKLAILTLLYDYMVDTIGLV